MLKHVRRIQSVRPMIILFLVYTNIISKPKTPITSDGKRFCRFLGHGTRGQNTIIDVSVYCSLSAVCRGGSFRDGRKARRTKVLGNACGIAHGPGAQEVFDKNTNQ